MKTSLAPGLQVVTDYLARAGLQDDLDALGFNLVGYGCTTCIGNSGPLPEAISDAINRKRPGRRLGALRQPQLRGPRQPGRARQLSRLAAAGRRLCARRLDAASTSTTEPLGTDRDGKPVYLKDIWPSSKEIAELVRTTITAEMFRTRYADVFKGDEHWQKIKVEGGQTYRLDRRLDLRAEPALLRGHEA